jgi:hypothetical protein
MGQGSLGIVGLLLAVEDLAARMLYVAEAVRAAPALSVSVHRSSAILSC